MKKASSLSMVFTLCALIVASLSASAQSTFTWNGSTSGNWTNTTSWIPEAPFGGPTGNGTIVIFNNPTAANCDVSLLGANPTVGSLTVNSSLGTAVRFGNSTDSSSGGVLTLASDSTPVLNVSGNSSLRLAIFAELSGTQGFTKTGNGTLNFNTNTLDMNNLSGTVTLQDGTVWINQAGNLGTGNLSFTGNSTLQMRGNFTTTFGANRSVTIASGVTATLSNSGS